MKKTIKLILVLLILAFGLLALIVSIPLAVAASYGLVNMLAQQINIILQPYRFEPMVLLVMVLGALSVPLIAGYVPVRHGSRTG